ncbi:hypothetical protein [Adlercreutzia aquisgranensis]|uniref:hypothetical protein n=1 Tax=Adlercreutzia aquisgranensis TaxID=2941323 RepID=UPI00203CFF6D|nr:hypothetical protein [Adlercreutzia aquisgranensis]
MTNLIFVLESMRRHAKLIVATLVVALVCGAGWSLFQSGWSDSDAAYVAEVTFYVDGHESDEVNEYNYELNEDYLASDVRRVIVSGRVAGEVRQEYGSDVTVKTPYWVNRETKGNVYSHYIYAEVAAPTPDLALAAAQAVAEKTLTQVREQLPVATIELTEGPLLKTVAGMAADYGVDDFAEDGFRQNVAAVSPKTVFIFGFCGFALALVVAVAKDLFARRIWTRNDVTRLFGIPVIDVVDAASVGNEASYYQTAAVLSSLCAREGVASLGVCGIGSGSSLGEVTDRIGSLAKGYSVVCSVDLLRKDAAMLDVASADAVLLVAGQGAGGAGELSRVSSLLGISDIPCVGAVLLVESEKKAS